MVLHQTPTYYIADHSKRNWNKTRIAEIVSLWKCKIWQRGRYGLKIKMWDYHITFQCHACNVSPSLCHCITTGKTSLADCLPCPGGQYCQTQGQTTWTGDCAAGFYCTINSTSDSPTDGVTGDECPPGHHCPVQSPAPVACADGMILQIVD